MEFDDASFRVTDWAQYNTDLARDNAVGAVAWARSYSLTDYAGVGDASAASFDTLLTAMATNETVFNAYFLHYHGRNASGDPAEHAPSSCWPVESLRNTFCGSNAHAVHSCGPDPHPC